MGYLLFFHCCCVITWDEIVMTTCCFGSKVGNIDPKWAKSVTFSSQISVYFSSTSQHVPTFDLKNYRICTILGQTWYRWLHAEIGIICLWIIGQSDTRLGGMILVRLVVQLKKTFIIRYHQTSNEPHHSLELSEAGKVI